MAELCRVQDDLYRYVNQEWIDSAVIPDDKPRVGGFSDLDEQVEKQLMEDFRRMAAGELPYPDADVKNAVALYTLALDTDKRNALGISPALPRLQKLREIGDMDAFNAALPQLVKEGYTLPFSVSVEGNMKDSGHHCLMLAGPSTILPDTTYYLEDKKQAKEALLGIWSSMVSQLLAKTDLTETERELYLQDALAFDAVIATLVKSREEWSEYVNNYNPMPMQEVAACLQPIAFREMTEAVFGKAPEEVMVAEPRFLNGFSTLFDADALSRFCHWAYIKELISASGSLSEELRELGTIYIHALSGVSKNPTIEKEAYRIASDYYSEPVGLYYGRTYFGEAAKKDVEEMVREIIETYKHRVSVNDILSEQTKQKAIVKLDKMVIKMGYPDVCAEYFHTLVFDPVGSLFGELCKLRAIRRAYRFSKLYEDVDRTEWVMAGHIVNACYNPETNDITFPAAILQAPFYSLKQSRSENLGGIGAVIGHEISHAFDNNGAKCDENGNLHNWWTDEDFARFNDKTQAMIEQFDGIELEQGRVNGAFIVSENIADNGGMAVTLEIMSHMENPDYPAYFCNWARVWCMKARPEFLKLLLAVDVHGPAVLRANMPPRNFAEWYAAFGVQSTDQMYISPEKRVVIW